MWSSKLTFGWSGSRGIYFDSDRTKKRCTLIFREGFWYARVRGRTSVVKVNGKPVIIEELLRNNDEICFGKHAYMIRYDMPRKGAGGEGAAVSDYPSPPAPRLGAARRRDTDADG